MEASAKDGLYGRVRTHAFRSLSFSQRQTTNLHLDERVYAAGETIGPRRQKIVADRSSLLVFADDQPMANFSHDCRYLLYESKNGEFYREVHAQFPPFVKARPPTLKAFHEPVQFIVNPNLFAVRPYFHCPVIVPEGDRYAILFAGMSNKRHLDDLEFLYRTLVDTYSFEPDDIYALSYDGTLNTQDGVQSKWPGDNTAFRIKVTGEGTRQAFESAVDDLKGKLGVKDTLLISSNNHGGYDGTPGTANLCTYPNWDGYYANDFASKVGELPKFRQLIVMMEQCHAGGFNAPILAKSTASATSIASAVIEPNNSWGTPDGNWDYFARDWTSAQAGHDPYGAALASNPDTDGNGWIEAEEAFGYANSVHYSGDSPNFSESSEAGGDIALGQEYVIWWWWCIIVREVLQPHYIKLPPEEYYAKLRQLQPELSKLVASLDKTSTDLRKEMTERVKAAAAQTFGGG